MSYVPATRQEAVVHVRTVQSFLHAADESVKVNAASTLLKKPLEELLEMLGALLGDNMTLAMNSEGELVVRELADEAPPVNGARRGGKALQAAEGIVTVLAASNPKRDGSATHARFDLLKSGMTVAEYISAVEKATGTHRGARRTLRKAVAAGLVVVS